MVGSPVAFVDSRGGPASTVAVGAVKLLLIPRQDFRRSVRVNPETALAVLRDFSSKLYHLTALTHDLSLRSVRGRLARFSLTHAQAKGASPTRWTQEEIAAQIGTVREVVSRTLRAFIRDSLIKMERQRIMLFDRDTLALTAES